MHSVILKPGKDKPILNKHHWIFSGAIQSLPDFQDGEFLLVKSSKGDTLGIAYFNKKAKIIGRMISFEETTPIEAIHKSIKKAIEFRKSFFHKQETNAFRIINGEGDSLPGLIVDKYDQVLVVQYSTLGMEKIADEIIEILIQELKPKAIYEKSTSSSRKEEGLKEVQRLVYGDPFDVIKVKENGLNFFVDVPSGQKTGFFLDQSAMRKWIGELSHGKRVLNTFCYTGGFSLYAMAGGATQVDSVDISSKAIDLLQKNIELNGFENVSKGNYCEDVFKFLREKPLNYDLAILDPPAFAKRKSDIIPACRGYKDINRITMEKMPKNSLLLTCSCSYHVDEQLFRQVLFQAAIEARRNVRILGKHRQAFDHPVNLFHPEGDYLKSFLLFLE